MFLKCSLVLQSGHFINENTLARVQINNYVFNNVGTSRTIESESNQQQSVILNTQPNARKSVRLDNLINIPRDVCKTAYGLTICQKKLANIRPNLCSAETCELFTTKAQSCFQVSDSDAISVSFPAKSIVQIRSKNRLEMVDTTRAGSVLIPRGSTNTSITCNRKSFDIPRAKITRELQIEDFSEIIPHSLYPDTVWGSYVLRTLGDNAFFIPDDQTLSKTLKFSSSLSYIPFSGTIDKWITIGWDKLTSLGGILGSVFSWIGWAFGNLHYILLVLVIFFVIRLLSSIKSLITCGC